MSRTVSVPVRGPKDVPLLLSISRIEDRRAKALGHVREAFVARDWERLRAALYVWAEDAAPLGPELEKLARVLHAKADVQMPEPRADESAADYVARVQRAGVEYVREVAG